MSEFYEMACSQCLTTYYSTSTTASCPACVPDPKVTQPDRPSRLSDWADVDVRGPVKLDPEVEKRLRERPEAEINGGVKFDDGKPRWDLLPMDALNDVAAVLQYGAKKYAARNWEKGMHWGRLQAAALRHLAAWSIGQDEDIESGLPHLAHAACCVLMLLAMEQRGIGTDDRSGAEDV